MTFLETIIRITSTATRAPNPNGTIALPAEILRRPYCSVTGDGIIMSVHSHLYRCLFRLFFLLIFGPGSGCGRQ